MDTVCQSNNLIYWTKLFCLRGKFVQCVLDFAFQKSFHLIKEFNLPFNHQRKQKKLFYCFYFLEFFLSGIEKSRYSRRFFKQNLRIHFYIWTSSKTLNSRMRKYSLLVIKKNTTEFIYEHRCTIFMKNIAITNMSILSFQCSWKMGW